MQRILFAALLCLLLALPVEVGSVGLPPGTEIQLRATGEFTNIYDESQTAAPATITLKVMQVAGATVDWDISHDTVVQGEFVYFPVRITNTGNGIDTFNLTAVSVHGWETAFIYDENNDGVHDDTEAWEITDTTPLVSDGYCPCFLRVLIPDEAAESDTVTVTAISTFNPARGTASADIDVPEPGKSSSKLTASADLASPYVGQTVTISGALHPALAEPLTLTLITPEGNITSSTITTGQDGSFQTAFSAEQVGTYDAVLAFDGDESRDSCDTTVSITVQEKIISSIDLACAPSAPEVGDSVTITGILTPVLQAGVDLTCTIPSGSSTQYHLTADSGGTFTWNTAADAAGTWYFQATYAGDESHTSCTRLLALQVMTPTEPEHTLTINAGPSVSPSAVSSCGSAQCSVGAADSIDHQISYYWSDGDAGGTFVPSADVQSPSYTAPENSTGENMTITLTCTAACNGDEQLSTSGSTQLTVYTLDTSAPEIVSVTPANGVQCVGLASNVVVRFSKSMSHAPTEAALSFTPALDSPQFSWSADSKTLTISHADLAPNTGYVADITTTALDSGSIAMENDYTWAFKTASGGKFDPNEITAETNKEFVLPHLIFNAPEATTVTAFIYVPEGIEVNTAMSDDGLECVEAGADVSSIFSAWDSTTREISITADLSNPSATAEIVKGITLISPTSAGTSQISIDGCPALNIMFIAPLPGDFNDDLAVNITDAADFITEWIRWHGTAIPEWSAVVDGKFDLAPHIDGVWPDWTVQGDQCIDIADASAFVDCWIGAHPSGSVSSASYRPVLRCQSYARALAGGNEIAVAVNDAPDGVFETAVEIPGNARFNPALDTFGNLRNVAKGSGTGGLLFSEYDASARTVRLAGCITGTPPCIVAYIRLGR